ncbi:De-etiolated protein 1 Det1-domain-containing protein [Syncephalis plumigaleata]|nr:De-etiolated protein 1 Det1-domain-containing protein [Syncephalis plumigaleata]
MRKLNRITREMTYIISNLCCIAIHASSVEALIVQRWLSQSIDSSYKGVAYYSLLNKQIIVIATLLLILLLTFIGSLHLLVIQLVTITMMNNHSVRMSVSDSSRIKRLQRPGLLPRLWQREYQLRRPGTKWRHLRSFYLDMCPNDAIFNVQIPRRLVLKRFSPDGKYLIAFSAAFDAVIMFTFRGPCLQMDISNQALGEQPDVFSLFFKPRCKITLCTQPEERIQQHVFLFSSDTRYLIVVSASQTDKTASELRPNTYTIPKSAKLENYRLHVIDIQRGQVTDTISMELDYIQFEKHAGISIRNDFIAITSLHEQEIRLYRLTNTGKLHRERSIGLYNYQDDGLVIAEQLGANRIAHNRHYKAHLSDEDIEQELSSLSVGSIESNEPESLDTTNIIPGLRQRILSYLYRSALEQPNRHSAIMNFYYIFPHITDMIFYKAQFIDDVHLMIRLCTRQSFITRSMETASHTFFLVVYDVLSTRIISISENTSESLLKLVEHGVDFLRGPMYNFPIQQHCSFSNNLQTNQLYHRQQYTLQNARNGSKLQATKHLLSMLPFSPQTLFESPFMDRSLFTYDEKTLVPQERPAPGHDFPIKFFDRRTGQLRFRLFTFQPHNRPETLPKRYTYFIFHPTLPFVMAVQQPPQQAFYHSPTIICYYRRPKWERLSMTQPIPLSIDEDGNHTIGRQQTSSVPSEPVYTQNTML